MKNIIDKITQGGGMMNVVNFCQNKDGKEK